MITTLVKFSAYADGYFEPYNRVFNLSLISKENAEKELKKLTLEDSFDLRELSFFLDEIVLVLMECDEVRENDGLQVHPEGVIYFINTVTYVKTTELSAMGGDVVRVISISEKRNDVPIFIEEREDDEGYTLEDRQAVW